MEYIMQTKKMFQTLLLATVVSIPLVFSGCAVIRDQQTVGSYVDDATLTTKVKASFAQDPGVGAAAISVETLKGTVQLSGFAKSETERLRAAELARAVEGVKEVRNSILVRTGS
jgi:hyperosmotically inducible periplasmic protein